MSTTLLIKGMIAACWIWLWNFFLPIGHYMGFTIILILVDFATGIAAARHRGETLRSRGFARSILKIGLYCGTIIISHGMDKVFFAPQGLSFGLVWIVAGLIGLSEFKSNLENVAVVTGLDIWAAIADRIPGLPKLPKKN